MTTRRRWSGSRSLARWATCASRSIARPCWRPSIARSGTSTPSPPSLRTKEEKRDAHEEADPDLRLAERPVRPRRRWDGLSVQLQLERVDRARARVGRRGRFTSRRRPLDAESANRRGRALRHEETRMTRGLRTRMALVLLLVA